MYQLSYSDTTFPVSRSTGSTGVTSRGVAGNRQWPSLAFTYASSHAPTVTPIAGVGAWRPNTNGTVLADIVLGKLFDPSLEPYLAQLATRFLSDPRLSWHLRQTAIALDNLDRIPELRTLEDQDDTAALTRIVRDYLRAPR